MAQISEEIVFRNLVFFSPKIRRTAWGNKNKLPQWEKGKDKKKKKLSPNFNLQWLSVVKPGDRIQFHSSVRDAGT